jgi:hypothetical protein
MDLFESLFQVWLAEGGLTKPALSEDIDRRVRSEAADPNKLKKKELCPHGKSILLCNVCYFNNYDPK